MEDQIDVPIPINILQGRVHRSSLSAGWTEQDCGRVYGGGIKGVSRQDRHRGDAFASRVDAVRVAPRFDVDCDLGCGPSTRESLDLRIGEGMAVDPNVVDVTVPPEPGVRVEVSADADRKAGVVPIVTALINVA